MKNSRAEGQLSAHEIQLTKMSKCQPIQMNKIKFLTNVFSMNEHFDIYTVYRYRTSFMRKI